MTARKTVQIKGNTELELLEPTEVPRQLLDIFRRRKLTPTFYARMGDMYCFHYDGEECGIAFFFLADGVIYVPEPGQPELLALACRIADFVHEIGE